MLILKESFMLTVYFLIAFVSLVIGSIITNKKVRKVAVCGVIISIVGLIYMFMPFHVTNLTNPEDVAFFGNEVNAHYRKRTLTEEQVEKIVAYIPDLKLRYKKVGYLPYAYAINAYSVDLSGKDGHTWIYLDYGEPENCFLSLPNCDTWFQIDYESAEELLTYLKEVVGDVGEVDFPMKENGYPDTDYVSINGELYLTQVSNRETISEEIIEVSIEDKDKEIVVVLPQCVNILKWVVKDCGIGIELIEQRRYFPSTNGEYGNEGESPYLYEFVFDVTEESQMDKVVFGLMNVDSAVSSEAYYTLTIKFAD